MSSTGGDAVALVAVGLVWPGSSQSCLDRAAFWRLIREGRHATTPALPEHSQAGRLSDFVDQSVASQSSPAVDRCAHDLICGVQDWEYTARALAQVIDDGEGFLARDRPAQFAVAAAWQAIQECASYAQVQPGRRRVILGNLALPSPGLITLDRAWHSGSGDAMLARFGQSLQEPAQAIAERFDCLGGAHTLDAACASSLFAIWEGAVELLSGRCDLVVAGGVQASDALFTQMGFAQLGALSAKGRCRPFDRYGDGLVVGEGAGVFVLRRLSDALSQGDTVLAVLRGGGLSNDRDRDLLRPSQEGQIRAMRAAYASSKVSPTSIDLLECHATGTPTGDREELRSFAALRQECSDYQDRVPPVLGATKANVGHWLTGAGAASVAKVLAALQNQELPPLGGYTKWGQDDSLSEHFRVLKQAQPWPESSDRPRRAAVSAFGFGGTNAHLILDAFHPKYAPSTKIQIAIPKAPTPWEILGSAQISGQEEAEIPGCGPLQGLVVPLRRIGAMQVGMRQFASTSPKDLQAASAQQVALLRVAQAAWERFENAHPERREAMAAARTGVWIALDSDPRAAAFARRWEDNPEAGDLSRHPELDAAGTLGHLGGIVASRVARELGCGGPCYVLSAADRSFRVAMQRALASIESGEVDFAVVGAVACLDDEVSATMLQLRNISDRSTSQEGALAVVLGRASSPAHGFHGIAGPSEQPFGGQNIFEQAQQDLHSLFGLEPQEVERVEAEPDALLELSTQARIARPPLPDVPALAIRDLQAASPVHESFLRLSAQTQGTIQQLIAWQQQLASLMSTEDSSVASAQEPARATPLLDRAACLLLANGPLVDVFGPQFAAVDALPSRVRLPEEPLMLVDRIMSIEGEALSMQPGGVVTEHDVHDKRFYLDAGRIPTCMAVESGQADLILSGFLGIDLRSQGLAHYRLLDAVVTFEDELPRVGQCIRYDIKIVEFFNQGGIDFFRFSFDAFVGDRKLMTMREGCAGFFTPAQLAEGRGVVQPQSELPRESGAPALNYRWTQSERTSLATAEIDALIAGDLTAAFGSQFEGLALTRPQTLPQGEKMRLVHEVSEIDFSGGRWGLGRVLAHAPIHADDWFLTCHFHDDKVMPGTLMYECCLHSLRILMMAQGWVGESERCSWQPVLGVQSRLKCRGQVLDSCNKVTYEVQVRKIDFGPEPYVIADALMYADGHCIVEITDMSLRLCGSSHEQLSQLWNKRSGVQEPQFRPAVYDQASILAYSVGKPSEAFGAPYEPFDEDRKIARLPGPPFLLMDRVVQVRGEPFAFTAGAGCTAQVAVEPDAWYFKENRQSEIPYSILLEMVLQPCGWLAGYVGSALQSDQDLRFRNLGGTAKLFSPVVQGQSDILTTEVSLTDVSASSGMILQSFEFSMKSERSGQKVYEGTTQFGFFSAQALARQVGIREESAGLGSVDRSASVEPFAISSEAPYPDQMMRMIDRVRAYLPEGGSAGLGWIEGEIEVDPKAWFFAAHFFEDPVWPGSLGIEAFLQLVKVMAFRRWPAAQRVSTLAVGQEHRWVYRGQVIPQAKMVRVQAEVLEVDTQAKRMRARGWLFVDGRLIYQMHDFTLGFEDAH